MGGFNSVFGFLFAFMIIVGIIVFSFTTLTEQVGNYASLQKATKDKLEHDSSDFSLITPYYTNGRLKLNLKNTGDNNLFFRNGQNICFDVFINGNYISNENYNLYYSNPIANYYFIEPSADAILDIEVNINSSEEVSLKVIACSSVNKEAFFSSSKLNWLNDSYKLRSYFTYVNPFNRDRSYNTTLITLNSNNFDFAKGETDTIALLLPLYQNTVLDANFDFYNQTLKDSSRYKTSLTLGQGSSISSDDPSEIEGIFFNALEFDGLNDTVRVSPDKILELEKELTYSAWIKWRESGNKNNTIFRNGRNDNILKIINDNSGNDKKVFFSLTINDINRKVYSSTNLDSNWHMVTGTFNGSLMNLYIDKTLVGTQSITYASVNASSLSNYIGSTNTSFEFFNGTIDEVKIFNIALTSDEVSQLYNARLRFRELNYTIESWSTINKNATLNVTLPFVEQLDNITFELYYYLYGEKYNATS